MPCALPIRSEEHTSELQSPCNLVCRLLLEKKKTLLWRQDGTLPAALGRLHLIRPDPTAGRADREAMLPLFFFFNDTATTEIYTLSLHDALPICRCGQKARLGLGGLYASFAVHLDRKSTRLNSSHLVISYAVFCLKKKKRGH